MTLELLKDPSFLGVLGSHKQGLPGVLSDHSLQVNLESLGAQQGRTPFLLQNLALPRHHENQVDPVLLRFLVCHADPLAHPNTSARERPDDLEIPLDLEVHQNLEGLASQGRLHYKELYHLSDPSGHQDPSRPGSLELLVALSPLVGQGIPVLEAPWVLFSPGGPVVQEVLYHPGLHLHDPPGVLGPLFLQHIHLDRVVPAGLEIQGAHQDLFLLCAL